MAAFVIYSKKLYSAANAGSAALRRLKVFEGMRSKITNLALGAIKEKIVNPNLEGIGTIKAISYTQGEISLTLVLMGLEDRPINLRASEIAIAPDGSSITVGRFESDMAFVQNGLDKFLAGRPFEIPEGSPRMALKTAKTVLGL